MTATKKNSYSLRVRFWGVRGSTPTPNRAQMGYGGNTSCVEVETREGALLILDAGTGLRLLGDELLARAQRDGSSVQASILISHLHWDHIQGFPFFRPVYDRTSAITIYASAGVARRLQPAFRGQLSDPYFPVAFSQLPAHVQFKEFSDGPVALFDTTVSSCALHHPQGATAYRIECGGRALTYASDHEHGDEKADQTLVELAQSSDVLICDSQYTPEEYKLSHTGWGHSTWKDMLRLAERAKVKKVVLTHHDPWHDDAALDAIAQAAKQHFSNCELAREGWEFTL